MEKLSCYISVSEPWDFDGPNGKNIIKGKIMKIINNDCVIFKSDSDIKIDEVEGNIFVLLSRYFNNHFSSINNEQFWSIGGGILLLDSYEGMDKNQLEQNSKYVIIGSLRKL